MTSTDTYDLFLMLRASCFFFGQVRVWVWACWPSVFWCRPSTALLSPFTRWTHLWPTPPAPNTSKCKPQGFIWLQGKTGSSAIKHQPLWSPFINNHKQKLTSSYSSGLSIGLSPGTTRTACGPPKVKCLGEFNIQRLFWDLRCSHVTCLFDN